MRINLLTPRNLSAQKMIDNRCSTRHQLSHCDMSHMHCTCASKSSVPRGRSHAIIKSTNKAAELEISAKTVLLTMSGSLAPTCQPPPHKSRIFIVAKNQQLSNVMPMGK